VNTSTIEFRGAAVPQVGESVLELLLFYAGLSAQIDGSEILGINVLKVVEITQMPELMPIVNSHPVIMGLANIRGQLIPVLNLPRILGSEARNGQSLLLVAQFSRKSYGFAVSGVDQIVQVPWDAIEPSGGMPGQYITGFARSGTPLGGARMVQVLDVEGIVQDVFPDRIDRFGLMPRIRSDLFRPNAFVLAADDSAVARAITCQVLGELGIPVEMTRNGREAWERLCALYLQVQMEGVRLQDRLALVLTDLEMPQMDGIALCRSIKSDTRFEGIPVLIHSSLAGVATEEQAIRSGADGYLTKFVREELGRKIVSLLPVEAPPSTQVAS
jgi:two-component system chemotaxis response regulator CheV